MFFYSTGTKLYRDGLKNVAECALGNEKKLPERHVLKLC